MVFGRKPKVTAQRNHTVSYGLRQCVFWTNEQEEAGQPNLPEQSVNIRFRSSSSR